MKEYKFKFVRKDVFEVERIDEKKQPGKRYNRYIIDLRNGGMTCDCKGFYYTKKKCKHIAFILDELKEKRGVIKDEKGNL